MSVDPTHADPYSYRTAAVRFTFPHPPAEILPVEEQLNDLHRVSAGGDETDVRRECRRQLTDRFFESLKFRVGIARVAPVQGEDRREFNSLIDYLVCSPHDPPGVLLTGSTGSGKTVEAVEAYWLCSRGVPFLLAGCHPVWLTPPRGRQDDLPDDQFLHLIWASLGAATRDGVFRPQVVRGWLTHGPPLLLFADLDRYSDGIAEPVFRAGAELLAGMGDGRHRLVVTSRESSWANRVGERFAHLRMRATTITLPEYAGRLSPFRGESSARQLPVLSQGLSQSLSPLLLHLAASLDGTALPDDGSVVDLLRAVVVRCRQRDSQPRGGRPPILCGRMAVAADDNPAHFSAAAIRLAMLLLDRGGPVPVADASPFIEHPTTCPASLPQYLARRAYWGLGGPCDLPRYLLTDTESASFLACGLVRRGERGVEFVHDLFTHYFAGAVGFRLGDFTSARIDDEPARFDVLLNSVAEVFTTPRPRVWAEPLELLAGTFTDPDVNAGRDVQRPPGSRAPVEMCSASFHVRS